jgi:hypothetical protein
MSNTKYRSIIGAACASWLALAACGAEPLPGLGPNRVPEEAPARRDPGLRSPEELKLCDRRVPPPRC